MRGDVSGNHVVAVGAWPPKSDSQCAGRGGEEKGLRKIPGATEGDNGQTQGWQEEEVEILSFKTATQRKAMQQKTREH